MLNSIIKPMAFFVALSSALVITGCGNSDFRAEEVPSKAEIQKQIDQVKSNASIPDAAKPNIIRGLEAKMKNAK